MMRLFMGIMKASVAMVVLYANLWLVLNLIGAGGAALGLLTPPPERPAPAVEAKPAPLGRFVPPPASMPTATAPAPSIPLPSPAK
ncbi:MAG TPA: hypothetical protein VD995_34185 [Azospirillum sp.]|nr:hypothetical protein [Azospirillum sp.]